MARQELTLKLLVIYVYVSIFGVTCQHILAAGGFYIKIDGSVRDCSNSIAKTRELLQSCTEPSIYIYII